MSEEKKIVEAIKRYTPKSHKPPTHCALCGKELTFLERKNGICRCQILTLEQLHRKMTI